MSESESEKLVAQLRESAQMLTAGAKAESESMRRTLAQAFHDAARLIIEQGNRIDFLEHERDIIPVATAALNDVRELRNDAQRAFDMLAINGVSRERARSVSNGIEVLATRIQRQIDSLERQLDDARASDVHLLWASVKGSDIGGIRHEDGWVLWPGKWIDEMEAERDAALKKVDDYKAAARMIQESAEIGMQTLRTALTEVRAMLTDYVGAADPEDAEIMKNCECEVHKVIVRIDEALAL